MMDICQYIVPARHDDGSCLGRNLITQCQHEHARHEKDGPSKHNNRPSKHDNNPSACQPINLLGPVAHESYLSILVKP
jgi:hypothetical protein